MGDKTGIQWTDATWNPVTGCSQISPGCAHCYAKTLFPRAYGKDRKFEDVRFHFDRLDQPLRWSKPRRVFVNSMSDLFHESLSDEAILAIFGIMGMAHHHTFQVLTKRHERMEALLGAPDLKRRIDEALAFVWQRSVVKERLAEPPYPNVWLGVSVENQGFANERIPFLLRTPAAVRFLSCEPLLRPIDLRLDCGNWQRIGWVIVGGESGPGARPMDIGWARSIVMECKRYKVPVFVKQLGAHPIDTQAMDMVPNRVIGDNPTDEDLDALAQCLEAGTIRLRDRKGGDPSEWPEDLRVREFPA